MGVVEPTLATPTPALFPGATRSSAAAGPSLGVRFLHEGNICRWAAGAPAPITPVMNRWKMRQDGRTNAAPNAVRFEALVLPHLDELLAFARGQVRTDADAEDVVQEACARAWQGFAGLREDGRARAWLFRILRRVVIDQRAQESRRSVEVAPLEAAHERVLESPDPGPFEHLLARLSHERVRDALDRIPEEFAMAVALCDIAGFRYREVAEILEVPVGTVMSRIHRGRKLLAGWVVAEGDGAAAKPVASLPEVVPIRRART